MLQLPKNSDILILAAHPDDETLGCGATAAKLSEEGHNIHLMTFTDGVDARDEKGKENRNNRLGRISEILGINSFNHGDFPDNSMDVVPLLKLCKYIENHCPFAPDLIFTHHPDCLNIDHEMVYRATLTAFRPQFGLRQTILSYFVPSSTDYNPQANFNGNVYVDIKGYVDKKLKALSVYDEEMREHPHSRSYTNVKNLSSTWGSEVGLESAEKFQLIRSVS
jgi:LmbE family N-acetylglucosaminyl deacetylase|tara:strand:+ start:751 stop:1416 length:666 start_codon:yes stop_codon:yes gene_type:complete